MSVMSSSGSTPLANRFIATLTTSRLPVRSPLPNSVPSTRSAPAMIPNSAAATAQPRSLCGCRLSTTDVAVLDRAAEPLDDVAVDVRRVALDGRRQVEDDRPLRRRLDDVHHRLADLDGELRLGQREALRRVLVADRRAGHGLLELAAQAGGVDGDVDDAVLVEAEHDLALQRVGRVVEVHDRPRRALRCTRRCARSAPGGTARAPGS